MKFIGNVLWFILGGFLISLIYFLTGLVFCITIIGIPFGIQLFKFAAFALCPFGKEVESGPNDTGCLNIAMNIIWILIGWWEIALTHLVFGALCAITIIGIPFALQHFKMAILTVLPFGKVIKSS